MHTAEKSLIAVVDQMRGDAAARDRRMTEIRAVRAGDANMLFPHVFNDDWPREIVANLIDTAARDLAESIAPLPALNCSSGAMKSDADKRRANLKNKIGHNYWNQSKLELQMFRAADRFLSYGFLPVYVEPDFDRQTPIIRAEDPWGSYFVNDRWGTTTRFARHWQDAAFRLAEQYPELTQEIRYKDGRDCGSEHLTVVRYHDKDECVIYLPDRDGLVLSRYENLVKDCSVQVAERPSLDDEARGQWDQVIWVQFARQALALMSLDATHKSVNAPIVLPRDATELEFGKDAIIRSDGQPRRLGLELPSSAFAMDQKLQQEQMLGQRTPEGRFGHIDASVVTGRGVQALMGGFDTQIKTAQSVLGDVLKRQTSQAFEMDEKLWPDADKKIRGTISGETFEVSYTPAKDIKGNYACDVTYGFAAGQSPAQAIVMLLQLQGAGMIDRDTFRRNMPIDIDTEQIQRNIDVEHQRDALNQGVMGLAQALPAMVGQGMDPMQVLTALANFAKLRADGVPVEDAALKAFTPPEAPAAEAGEPPVTEQDIAAQQAGQLPPGMDESGLAEGVAPGQQGMPPGGLPSLTNFISGLRGGQAVADVTTTRRQATGSR